MELSPKAMDDARTSRALANLRGAFILVLVSFHASLAYLGSTAGPPAAFDAPPFSWLAIPVVDERRFWGFDIYCAWEDAQAMATMFFLSGLFVPASLARKGPLRYALDRTLRLGLPFLFGVFLLAPLALYPVFHRLNPAAGTAAYLAAYRNLPFLPNGPQWFLGLLIPFSLAAALIACAPGALEALARLAAPARREPRPFLMTLFAAATLAYVPLALAYGPFDWFKWGAIAVQKSRPLFYGVFFLSGMVVGGAGLGQGLLAPDGVLAAHWRRVGALSLATLFAWMGLMGAALAWPDFAPLALVSALAYVAASVGGVLFVLAFAVRFLPRSIRWLEPLSRNALGVYVLHYPFVVWLQAALTGADMPALAKGSLVFAGTLTVSLTLAAGVRRLGPLAALIGEASWSVSSPPPPAAPAIRS